MRVYIKPDLEGITGVVLEPLQTSNNQMYYQEARRLMTADVNAVARGAVRAGADEVYVEAGHASWGHNMIFDEFIDEVRYMDGRSASRPISVMEEVYRETDAFFIVGQHPMRGTHRGVIEHTFLPPINELKVNGRPIGEMGMKAAVAGYYDVPVAFVSGCDQAVAEARDFFGDVEAVAVKKGLGRQSAILLPSSVTLPLLEDGAARAVERLPEFKPFKVAEPTKIEVEFQHTGMADAAEMTPYVERVDGLSLVFEGPFIEAFRALRSMIRHAVSQRR
jgi:D-amino peptidase